MLFNIRKNDELFLLISHLEVGRESCVGNSAIELQIMQITQLALYRVTGYTWPCHSGTCTVAYTSVTFYRVPEKTAIFIWQGCNTLNNTSLQYFLAQAAKIFLPFSSTKIFRSGAPLLITFSVCLSVCHTFLKPLYSAT